MVGWWTYQINFEQLMLLFVVARYFVAWLWEPSGVAAVVTCRRRPSYQSLWVCYFLNLGNDYDLLSDFLGPGIQDPKPEPSSMYVIMFIYMYLINIMWAAKPFQQFPAEPFWKPPPIFRVAIRQQCRVQLTFWQTGYKGICCTQKRTSTSCVCTVSVWAAFCKTGLKSCVYNFHSFVFWIRSCRKGIAWCKKLFVCQKHDVTGVSQRQGKTITTPTNFTTDAGDTCILLQFNDII